MRNIFIDNDQSFGASLESFEHAIQKHIKNGTAGVGYSMEMASLDSMSDPAVARNVGQKLQNNMHAVRQFAQESGIVASLESFDDQRSKSLFSTSFQNANWLQQNQINAAERAASIALEAASDPMAYFNGLRASLESFNVRNANRHANYTADYTGGDRAAALGIMDARAEQQFYASLEAFEANALGAAMHHSVSYNFIAAVQEPAIEALFRTIVMTRDQTAFFYEVMVDRFWNGALHTRKNFVNGDPRQRFKKHLLMDAIRRPSLLRQDVLNIVPVIRDTGADGGNKKDFMTDTVVAPWDRTIGGVTVKTAPLLIGKDYDLLEISSHPELLGNGTFDETDVLDSMLAVDHIYVSLDGTDEADKIVKFPLAGLERRNFYATVQGTSEEMDLKFINSELSLNKDTVLHNGAESELLKKLVPSEDKRYGLRLRVELHGTANVETAFANVAHASVKVESVHVITKHNEVETVEIVEDWKSVSEIKTLVENFKDMKVVGWYPDGNRTNNNVRSQGLLVDSDIFLAKFSMGVRSPVRLQKPIGSDKSYPTVEKLVSFVRTRQTADAYWELFRFRDSLKAYCNSDMRDNTRIPEFLGVGKFLVKPTFDEINIDISTLVKTQDTQDALENVRAGLVGILQESAARVLVQSQWLIASAQLNQGKAQKPHFTIVTDQYLPLFLSVKGDLRLLGENFDHTVIPSLVEDMDNTIFMTLTNPQGDGFDPLTFGHTFLYPELITTISPHNVNGAYKETVMVTPRYQHVVNLPILVQVNVKGLKEFINKYNVYRIKQED